ncbi:PaaI family thioesterase [Amylibacter sp. SFDW26]|uniref:PaaI family thioesterase n=1 Tax=Amylibacter sp. SFDW26 TaxID=2652722 RepID=UPI0012618D6A|nr:PaaI family thioesterase [Amylibacter sp. SFDW26]KAB7615666.1 PaaI family thioesterase [Amylibacter sp. SFDW26]
MELKMTIAEITAFLEKVFPQIDNDFDVISLSSEEVVVRMNVKERHLRPGGTVSGPSMFALADVSYYIATLAFIGPEALTVTTNCSIDFMRKPAATDMIAKARVLKLGRTLSVGDVLLYSEGQEEPVARANLTYAIPPKR